MTLFFCDLLRDICIYRWIWAASITSILCGVIFNFVVRLNGYPQKYDHPNVQCINCGRDMHLFGQCCAYGTWKQYDCVTYQVCKQMEQKDKQSDEEMLGWGTTCIVCGGIVFAIVILIAIILYRRELKRRKSAERRIQNFMAQQQNNRRQVNGPVPRRQPPRRQHHYVPIQRRQQLIEKQDVVVFEDNSTECSICLTQYDMILAVETRKGCGHKFHRNCLRDWEKRNASCPLCRKI